MIHTWQEVKCSMAFIKLKTVQRYTTCGCSMYEYTVYAIYIHINCILKFIQRWSTLYRMCTCTHIYIDLFSYAYLVLQNWSIWIILYCILNFSGSIDHYFYHCSDMASRRSPPWSTSEMAIRSLLTEISRKTPHFFVKSIKLAVSW